MVIYDLFGNLVRHRNKAYVGNLKWDGRNDRGEFVGSGGYICILKVGDEIISRHKIAVIK